MSVIFVSLSMNHCFPTSELSATNVKPDDTTDAADGTGGASAILVMLCFYDCFSTRKIVKIYHNTYGNLMGFSFPMHAFENTKERRKKKHKTYKLLNKHTLYFMFG